MKIAFVGTFGDKSVNGVEYACYLMARYLTDANHEVFFLYQNHNTGSFSDQWGIHHKVFKKQLPLFRHTELKDYLTYNPDEIEIFHLHSVFIPFNYYVSKILSQKNEAFIVTPHGGYMRGALAHSKSNSLLIKQLYTQIFEKLIVQRAAAMIATTNLEVEDFRRFGFTGRIDTIPNPIPIGYNTERHHAQSTGPTLLYLGRFDEHFKGLFFLLDTFKLLQQIRPDLKLNLYGEGDDEEKLIAYIKSKKIKNVEINPPVFGAKKEEVINNCSCYFQPSRWESFGMSALEAMSLGKPLVMTETCYLSDLLTKNKIGRVVPLEPSKAAEIIDEYLEYILHTNREGEVIKNIALSEFAADKVIEKTMTLYKEILSIKKGQKEPQNI